MEFNDKMDIKTARCSGMCNGVKRALRILEDALLELDGEKLYVYNDIVHNTFVINELKQKNVAIVKNVDDIPDGAAVVFSAHGVSRSVEDECRRRKLRIFDASCLLVKKNHRIVEDAAHDGKTVVFIGSGEHPECIGTVGRIGAGKCFIVNSTDEVEKLPESDERIVVVAQTTLSADDVTEIRKCLEDKYLNCEYAGGICYATSDRQNAVKELAKECDLILVAGSEKSSNSRKLVQIAGEKGCMAVLVDSIEELKDFDFGPFHKVGITAGASTPDIQIRRLIDFIRTK